ncbi:hypothetical protein [Polaromonas sp.]|uniref:hypothetical protein n=1 Tax=Polaromonas sp. TaxID=1869339 RepID=UPI003266B96B
MTLGMKGAVAGALYVRAKEESAQQDADIQELREKVFASLKRVTYRRAAKEALGELMEEVLEELAGRKPVRLSDPKNSELRNHVYVEKMAEKVDRAALGVKVPRGQEFRLSDEVKAKFKASRQLK